MISQKDLIKPLIFLDIFDYPPTAMEIWRFLGVKAELGEVIGTLAANVISNGVPSSRDGVEKSLIGDNHVKGFLADTRNDKGNDENWGVVRAVETHPGLRPPLQGGEYTGFCFLPGREALIEKRREFFHLSEKKFKIAKRAAWLLHFIPSVKMIAVCNNFYYREQSDIDFFIITAANRLWLTRFFATIILDIFGLRARGKKTADKVCLSFYLSEDSMNLEKIALSDCGNNGQYCNSLIETDSSPGARNDKITTGDEKHEARDCHVATAPRNDNVAEDDKVDDPYLSYWLAFLEPIYGQECYNKLWEANAWLKNIFPNALPKIPVLRRRVGEKNTHHFKLRLGQIVSQSILPENPPRRRGGATPPRRGMFLGNWLEKIAKKIQWQKIPLHVKEMAALNDNRVVINEAMLKFHENDRREEFRNNYKLRIINKI